MARKSIMAENLANDVISRIRQKKKVNLMELSVRNGYSVKSAIAQKGVQTKTFQNIVNPVVERMRKLHEKTIAELDNRDLSKERMDSVVNLSKQLVHDSQLLSDKSTENIATHNNVIVYGSDDFLALQTNSAHPHEK